MLKISLIVSAVQKSAIEIYLLSVRKTKISIDHDKTVKIFRGKGRINLRKRIQRKTDLNNKFEI